MANLLICMTKTSRWFWNADLAKNFARAQRRRKHVNKEIVRRDGPFAISADDQHFRTERNDCSRPIAGGIGMRHTAADRSFISYLHVADMRSTLRQQRTNLLEQR